MDASSRNTDLTDAQIRAIIDDTERQALGGWAGALARAGLGTLALTVAVLASTDLQPAGMVLLCGVFVLGLAAYIRSVARSVSKRPRISAQPARPGPGPPTESRQAPPPVAPATPATPATPVMTLGGIAGGSWSRLSEKPEA